MNRNASRLAALTTLALMAQASATLADGVRAAPPKKPTIHKLGDFAKPTLPKGHSKGLAAKFSGADLTPAGPKLNLKAKSVGGCIRNIGTDKSTPAKVTISWAKLSMKGKPMLGKTSPELVFPALNPGQSACLPSVISLAGLGWDSSHKHMVTIMIQPVDANSSNNEKTYQTTKNAGSFPKFFTDN